MKIQILDNATTFKKASNGDVVVRRLSDVAAFDAYDLTVISLQDKNLWINEKNNTWQINAANDLLSISAAWSNSQRCMVLVLLPQNIVYKYYKSHSFGESYYAASAPLKDMLSELVENILSPLLPSWMRLTYGKSYTAVSDIEIESDFSFIGCNGYTTAEVKSTAGGTTAIASPDGMFTTLQLETIEAICAVVELLSPNTASEATYPNWLDTIEFLDESEQQSSAKQLGAQIEELRHKRAAVEETLENYRNIKAMVCQKDQSLEDSVRSVLAEILDVPDTFIDEKEEDFRYEDESGAILFEIKGSRGNVQGQHITKTLHHVQVKEDNLAETGIGDYPVKGVLIISSQVEIAPSEREPCPKRQITLATRNEILIIPSDIFLRMYEAYLQGELDKSNFICILREQTGLVEYPPKKPLAK